jgi:hypothetical protein
MQVKPSRRFAAAGLAALGVVAAAVAGALWIAAVNPTTADAQPAAASAYTEPIIALPEVVVGRQAAPQARGGAPDAQVSDLLAVTSARLEDRVVTEAPVPVGLRIEALDVAAPVITAGPLPNGEMEVPEGIDEVAWYEFGPAPGEQGSAVLAAHVDLAGQGPGVFFALNSLERGARIAVDFADGSSRRFEVIDGATYQKDELDSERIFARTGAPALTLITCGGGFNPSLGRYDSNIVVFAAPVDDTAAAQG